MAAFDRQDEEDDFSGIDQGSRAEIGEVGRAILGTLLQYKCLVIFHNGSDEYVELISFGIPQPEFSGTRVLWTFRGRLRLVPGISGKVPSSHLFIYSFWYESGILRDEAREIASYTQKLGLGVTHEIVEKCCRYLLRFNSTNLDPMYYDWNTHACNYWVCDGIVQGGQDNQAWEVARALQKEIRLEDSCNMPHRFNRWLHYPNTIWIHWYDMEPKPDQRVTSLFISPSQSGLGQPSASLTEDRFHQADQLGVLKLRGCTFNFSAPPFHCCRNLRFLGLDSCMDQQQQRVDDDIFNCALAMEIFQRLWVLDVRYTDWELAFHLPPDETGHVATNIREVHIIKGRIWRHGISWRQLQKLRKIRVIEPTSSWETDRKDDEFTDMVKLDHLDQSRNNALQVLPSLSSATGLKTLILDGCVGLEHIGPQGLPCRSLQSFFLDTGEDGMNARVSHIILAGCARLVDFKLRGKLPNLKMLDLSRTSIKVLDLTKVEEVRSLARILLTGCEQLRSIGWPAEEMSQLRLLCIDTRGGETSHDLLVSGEREEEECCRAFVHVTDMRILQSLVPTSGVNFYWDTVRCKMNLCLSRSTSSKDDDERSCCTKEKVVKLAAGSLISRTSCASHDDGNTEWMMANEIDGISSAVQFQPLDLHVEIGEGMSDPDVVNVQGVRAISFVMNRVESLHVHDSESITTVIPEHIVTTAAREEVGLGWHALKWCRMERCPVLDTVFVTNYDISCFEALETFSAVHLMMARCIWSRGRTPPYGEIESFAKLRSIHLHSCPRLTFVLPLLWDHTLPSLNTLHIVCCGELRQVFPVGERFLKNSIMWRRFGMLEFPKLKHLYLHELPKLNRICEEKMFAPNLETISLRGCWSLRRLPATDLHSHPVLVDCEKDWWEKLEWDGLLHDHHPSFFAPRHSAYYKKLLLRGKILQ